MATTQTTDRLDGDSHGHGHGDSALDGDGDGDGDKTAEGDEVLDPAEREALLTRVRAYEWAATEQVDKLRAPLARAEEFAATLRARLEQSVPAADRP
ncbi:hypothetical protein [Streptomyces sp. NPDC002990]